MLPHLVPPEEFLAMVSLGVYSWNSGRIIGPLLGTALALTVGPAWTIGFNAASFVVLATAVALVRRSFRPEHSVGSITDRLVGGLRTARRTTGCWHGIALLVLFNLTIVPFMGLIPIYARSEYHGGTGLAGTGRFCAGHRRHHRRHHGDGACPSSPAIAPDRPVDRDCLRWGSVSMRPPPARCGSCVRRGCSVVRRPGCTSRRRRSSSETRPKAAGAG